MSEAKYIQDHPGVEMYRSKEDRQNSLDEFQDANAGTYKAIYDKNKTVKVGRKILCPVCKKEMIKKSYQHAFCSNKGRGNCKDSYWNLIDVRKYAVLRNNIICGD